METSQYVPLIRRKDICMWRFVEYAVELSIIHTLKVLLKNNLWFWKNFRQRHFGNFPVTNNLKVSEIKVKTKKGFCKNFVNSLSVYAFKLIFISGSSEWIKKLHYHLYKSFYYIKHTPFQNSASKVAGVQVHVTKPG